MTIDIPTAITAISGLGTASFALVDASKSVWGGPSNFGFGQIKHVLNGLVPPNAGQVPPNAGQATGNALSNASIRATLRANWLNGTLMADQKSIAKTLIKLKLDATTAATMAAQTGVDATLLASIAGKYASGDALTQAEQNVAGRFALLLTSLLDQAYQRGDQMYRNDSKMSAVVVAIGLAIAGKYSIAGANVDWGITILAGLLAAPLAPVSKDLASGLQASVKALQIFKK